jgi:hypothetical protein
MWLTMGIGLALIAVVLVDAFETLVLPRRVDRTYRLTILFYALTWAIWSAVAGRVPRTRLREALLAGYGPASLLLLLVVWAIGLIVGFALLQWALGPSLSAAVSHDPVEDAALALYFSGSTFFTLGYGDITPTSAPARVLAVVEAGVGFGFLALVISYLPSLYGPLTARERAIALFDARAGSPPSAAEVLRRHAGPAATERLHDLLVDWERWAAALLESHLAYPVLAYFRSQHENQSWVATLTVILDTCAILIADEESPLSIQARLTFATARHAAVDLSKTFRGWRESREEVADRLTPEEAVQLGASFSPTVEPLENAERRKAVWDALSHRRSLYEPNVRILSRYLRMPLPRFVPAPGAVDNWRKAGW